PPPSRIPGPPGCRRRRTGPPSHGDPGTDRKGRPTAGSTGGGRISWAVPLGYRPGPGIGAGIFTGARITGGHPPRTGLAASPSIHPGLGGHRRVGEGGDIAAPGIADLAAALLLHLVDADHGVERNETALDPGELGLELFLGGVDDHLGALAKDEFLGLEKAPEIALVHVAGVDLENLALIEEDDLVDRILCHDAAIHRGLTKKGRKDSTNRHDPLRHPPTGPVGPVGLCQPRGYNAAPLALITL